MPTRAAAKNAGLHWLFASQREEAWAKLAFAQSYAYAGQNPAALEQAEKLAQEHPGSPAASYGLLLAGDILYDQGKYQEARKDYQSVADSPNHKAALPLALADLALTQEAAGDCASAIATAQRFLDAYQDHYLAPPVHASLARCLAASGQGEKAKATFERMSLLYPQTYWADWAKTRMKG